MLKSLNSPYNSFFHCYVSFYFSTKIYMLWILIKNVPHYVFNQKEENYQYFPIENKKKSGAIVTKSAIPNLSYVFGRTCLTV